MSPTDPLKSPSADVLSAAADEILAAVNLYARGQKTMHADLRLAAKHQLKMIGYWLDLRQNPKAGRKRATEIRAAANRTKLAIETLRQEIAALERATGNSLLQWIQPINASTRQKKLPGRRAYRSLQGALPIFSAAIGALEEQLVPPVSDRGRTPRRTREPGIDELIVSLADLYQLITRRKPGIGSGNELEASGPFLRMIEKVWAVLGLRATTAARRKRVQRALAARPDN